jgi:hypothetical protein
MIIIILGGIVWGSGLYITEMAWKEMMLQFLFFTALPPLPTETTHFIPQPLTGVN